MTKAIHTAADRLLATIEFAMSDASDIILVSKEGQKFSVNENVAKANSPYFEAVLESKMLESGIVYIHNSKIVRSYYLCIIPQTLL